MSVFFFRSGVRSTLDCRGRGGCDGDSSMASRIYKRGHVNSQRGHSCILIPVAGEVVVMMKHPTNSGGTAKRSPPPTVATRRTPPTPRRVCSGMLFRGRIGGIYRFLHVVARVSHVSTFLMGRKTPPSIESASRHHSTALQAVATAERVSRI